MNMIFIGLTLCAAAIILWGINTYNNLIKAKVQVSEAWSTLDILLQKRGMKASELAHLIKDHVEQEDKEMLTELNQLQHRATIAHTIPEKSEAELQISTLLKKIFSDIDHQREVISIAPAQELTKQLKELDGSIQSARAHYNGVTRNYNILVHTIPSALIAKLMSFESQAYFEVI